MDWKKQNYHWCHIVCFAFLHLYFKGWFTLSSIIQTRVRPIALLTSDLLYCTCQKLDVRNYTVASSSVFWWTHAKIKVVARITVSTDNYLNFKTFNHDRRYYVKTQTNQFHLSPLCYFNSAFILPGCDDSAASFRWCRLLLLSVNIIHFQKTSVLGIFF